MSVRSTFYIAGRVFGCSFVCAEFHLYAIDKGDHWDVCYSLDLSPIARIFPAQAENKTVLK
jgi:hypothetical protein